MSAASANSSDRILLFACIDGMSLDMENLRFLRCDIENIGTKLPHDLFAHHAIVILRIVEKRLRDFTTGDCPHVNAMILLENLAVFREPSRG